jgi:subtilisin family serine protease
VTANAAALNIRVANMSLGGSGAPLTACPGTTDPEHKAICDSTAAGVIYAVAAGNSGWDYDYGPAPDTPAVYPEVLTVTASGDTDGLPGGSGGAPTCRSGEADDRYASFSNYATTAAAQNHTVAAPGVCIRSTWPGGGHDTISGTSMASPHMAGAVALCLGEAGAAGPCAGLTPAQIVQKMRADAQQRTQVQSTYGFAGDPTRPLSGRYYGHLGWAGTSMPAPAPRTQVSSAPAAGTIQSGTLRSGGIADLASADAAYLRFNSTNSSTRTTAWYGTFRSVPSTLGNLRVSYQGSNSRTCSQTLAIYRFTDGAWVTLDSRSVGLTETRIADRTPTGTLANYVSSTGDLRVRVRCTTTAGTFYASANQLRIAYDRPST